MQAKGGLQKTDEAVRNSAEKTRSNPEEKSWFEKIVGLKDRLDSGVRGDSKEDPTGKILRENRLRWFEVLAKKSAVWLPGRMPGMKPPRFWMFSAMVVGLKVTPT